jgi:hypothetical protein
MTLLQRRPVWSFEQLRKRVVSDDCAEAGCETWHFDGDGIDPLADTRALGNDS